MPEASQLRRILISLRLALGFVSFVLPRTVGRLFGIRVADNPSAPFLARLFGIREVLMAYQLYQASEDELEEVIRQGLLVDTLDIFAGFVSLTRREISVRTFALGSLTATAALAAGIFGRERTTR